MQKYKYTILIIVIIVILGILTSKLFIKSEKQTVFCTAEALQCPDGSYVGRTGSKCEFSACSNQTSFTGTLRQDSNGFQLIMASPDNTIQEVSYVIPLIIDISNALGELVGKKVEVSGEFTSGNTLKSERLEKSGDGDPSVGEVGIGKTVYINGVKITLNKIVQDSRCPTDVTCIWAGNTTFNVTLQSNTDKETVDIVSDKELPFDSYKISIEKVSPTPRSTVKIDSGGYEVTFRVRAN